MNKQLPPELDEALRVIANNQPIGLKANDINALLMQGYITYKYGGGWMVNSKGRTYLKQANKKV